MSSPKTQLAINKYYRISFQNYLQVVEVDALLCFTSRMTKGENQFVDFSKYFSRAAHTDSWYFTMTLTSAVQGTNPTLLPLLSLNIG